MIWMVLAFVIWAICTWFALALVSANSRAERRDELATRMERERRPW